MNFKSHFFVAVTLLGHVFSCSASDNEEFEYAVRNTALQVIEVLHINNINEKNRELTYKALIFDALVLHKDIYDPEKSLELLFGNLRTALGADVTGKIVEAKRYPQAIEALLGEKISLDKRTPMSSVVLLYSDEDRLKSVDSIDDLINYDGAERLMRAMNTWIIANPNLPKEVTNKVKSIISHLELDNKLLNRAAVDAYRDAQQHILTGKVPKINKGEK